MECFSSCFIFPWKTDEHGWTYGFCKPFLLVIPNMLDPVGEQTSKNGRLMVYDFYPWLFLSCFIWKKVHQPWWSGGLITTNSNGSQLNSQFQHSRLVKHPYLMAIRHWNSIFDVFCKYLLVLVAPPLFVPFNVGSWQVTGGNELAKYWPPLNFSGSTFNGQLSYYSFISLREYIFT